MIRNINFLALALAFHVALALALALAFHVAHALHAALALAHDINIILMLF